MRPFFLAFYDPSELCHHFLLIIESNLFKLLSVAGKIIFESILNFTIAFSYFRSVFSNFSKKGRSKITALYCVPPPPRVSVNDIHLLLWFGGGVVLEKGVWKGCGLEPFQLAKYCSGTYTYICTYIVICILYVGGADHITPRVISNNDIAG
jgi:hypothetical protein